jgi:hypothetical protein
MTPFEAWHGRKPSVGHLRIFGCTTSVKIAGPNLSKLSDRSKKMVFIGYEIGTKGYRLCDPSTAKLMMSRDVVFAKNEPWSWDSIVDSAVQQPDSFIVEYEMSDQNLTTAGTAVEQQQHDADQVQQGPADDVDGVNDDVSSPNSQHTPEPAQAHNHGWATPPSQYSDSSTEGSVRFRTVTDLLDSTDEVLDYEYSGVCMLGADEPRDVEQALEEKY